MKNKLFHFLPMIVFLLFTYACASVPLAPSEEEMRIKNMPPPPDKALLYVYRDNLFFGSAVMYHIYIDEQRIGGSLAVNNFLVIALEPGEHRFSYVASHLAPSALSAYLSDDYLPVQVDAGRKYYIKISAQSGPSRSRIVNVLPEAFQNAKLIDKSRQPALLQTVQTHDRPASPPAMQPRQTPRSDVDNLPPVVARTHRNHYAIVIGIESYRQKLPQADFAVSDARLVSEYLTKAMGYPEENVITLINDRAALGDFVKYFEKWLPNNVEKDSTVFVYYSGHGAPDTKTSGAYLVPYDGDPSFIAETGYSLKRMYDALGKLPAKEIVVALDSCFSGAGGRSVLAEGARPLVMNLQSNLSLPKNTTVLSASSGEQISSTYKDKGHGLFTYFLLKGIKEEDVVKPDGSIKIDDLFRFIKPRVERIARKQYNNEQTPQLIAPKE